MGGSAEYCKRCGVEATGKKPEIQNVCPECGHQFRGDGFDGIDAHWRSKHEHVMSYALAWPLIRTGSYVRRKGSIENFSGCLEDKNGPKFTIEEIKEATERAWAGER